MIAHFTNTFKDIGKTCGQHVPSCEQVFTNCSTSWHITIENTPITITAKPDRARVFFNQCQQLLRPKASFILQGKQSGVIATANVPAECNENKFFEDCQTFLQKQSAKLMPHEQGHFDLAKVMGDKTKAVLKEKAATSIAERTECGETAAFLCTVNLQKYTRS